MRLASLLLVSPILLGLILAGCTRGAEMQDPRTGQTAVCEPAQSPWSQSETCIADHLAQGWTIQRRQ